MELKENERIDDLQYKGLKIVQNSKGFCFGIDAVLLSDFAKNIRKNSVVLDLCTGTGIVAILLEAKTDAKKIYAVEIQNEIADMAKRSIDLNGQSEKIEIINDDLKNIDKYFEKESIDAITVNPPYKKTGSGVINELDTLGTLFNNFGDQYAEMPIGFTFNDAEISAKLAGLVDAGIMTSQEITNALNAIGWEP